MNNPKPDATYIFSSENQLSEPFFRGYCFIGRDYIAGPEGYKQYLQATGRPIREPEDGCYSLVEQDGDTFSFAADYWGYHKQFYYHQPGFWLVSNSLSLIADRLRAAGITPQPDLALLAAARGGHAALQQLPCFNTVIRGVELVPARCRLLISRSGAKLIPETNRPSNQDSYQTRLTRFFNLWLDRMETLLGDPRLYIAFDVTGGLDSRCVFALFQRARIRAGGVAAKVRFLCGSIRGDQKDLEVATRIAQAYDISINEKQPVPGARLSGEGYYRLYRELDLGCYHPIYPPYVDTHPESIHFGGGGGENYRPFFDKCGLFKRILKRITPWDSYQLYMNYTALRMHDQGRHARLLSTYMIDAVERIKNTDSSGTDPLMLYYQHFRNRFHVGLAPQRKINVMPLGSKLLHDVARAAGGIRLFSSQIPYDLIANLTPGLLDLPFDKASKHPTKLHRLGITRAVLAERGEKGNLYYQKPEPAPTPPKTDPFLVLLRKDLERLAVLPLAQQAFGPAECARIIEQVRAFETKGRFPHAADGMAAAALLSTAFFSPPG